MSHIVSDTRMQGKKLLVLGVDDDNKNFALESAANLCVKLFVMGKAPKQKFEKYISSHIYYDVSAHNEFDRHCDAIVSLVMSEIGDVDGCLTFHDVHVTLAAEVCTRLGKPGVSIQGALASKSKSETLKLLNSNCSVDGGTSRSKDYGSKFFTVQSADDLEQACEVIGFPAILKPTFGGGALGVRYVNSLESCRQQYEVIEKLFTHNSYMKSFQTYGRQCTLTEFLQGTEHSVDLAVFHGDIACAFITDKGPNRLPDIFHAGSTTPSVKSQDKQQAVVKAAYECCMILGLDHGVFNVDLVLTEGGPKLLEINARMGGYCQREYILLCYGLDLVHLACKLACDIRPEFTNRHDVIVSSLDVRSDRVGKQFTQTTTSTKFLQTIVDGDLEPIQTTCPIKADDDSKTNKLSNDESYLNLLHKTTSFCHIVGLSFYWWMHQQAFQTTASLDVLQRLHKEGEIIHIAHYIEEKDRHGALFCTVAVKEKSFELARKKLIQQCKRLRLDGDDVLCEKFLKFENL